MTEHNDIENTSGGSIDRRTALRRAGMAGGAAAVTTWAAPSILGFASASAAVSRTIPDPCVIGTDPHFDTTWVVCSADADRAWISSLSHGNYHADEICKSLGYEGIGQWGGNCGSVCGYCESGTSCDNPGRMIFDAGTAPNNCGSDVNGDIYCFTITWECLAPGVAPSANADAGSAVANSTGA